MSLKNLKNINEEVINNKKIIALFLTGSRATKSFTNLSDIDIAYFSNKKISAKEQAELLYNINKFLNTEEVDLIDMTKIGLDGQYNIIKYGKLLFCANQILLSDYFEYIYMRYFDFKPYIEEYIKNFKYNLKKGELIDDIRCK